MNKQINDTMVMPDQTTSENSHQIKKKTHQNDQSI